jgi:hypothetical protein
MGWNTGVLILNDAAHLMKADPARFVENLDRAMGEFNRKDGPVDFAIGNHVNGGSVFHQSHADNVGVYAIGGNHTRKFGEVYNGGDTNELKLLKQLADQLGFRLVKKSGSSG